MGYPDNAVRAVIQSYARTYPEGINLVTSGRPSIKTISIQNRDNKVIYFWHGRINAGVLGDGALLAVDPTTWTAQQKLDAAVFVKAYGEAIAAGATFEPKVAHAGALYSVVEVGTAIAHVKEGL